MSYHIETGRSAQRELDHLNAKTYEAVALVISSLSEQPRPHGAKKLTDGSNLWRVRVGRLRVVYSIDDKAQNVTVVRVARRSEHSYKGLRN